MNIALGTDGMSSHNTADLFSDLKLAACLHKGIRRDPTAVTARQALEMATARAPWPWAGGTPGASCRVTGLISSWWTSRRPTWCPATTSQRTWSLLPTEPTWS